MFNPVIETAIGVIFVYLLLSMICSALQEWVAALLALRAKTLEQGIQNMLAGDDDMLRKIFDHPLIGGITRQSFWDRALGRPGRPSYISAGTFSKAFLSAARITDATIETLKSLPPVENPAAPNAQPAQKGGPATRTLEVLRTFATTAPGDIDTLRKNIEDWFNDSMDRVSGWYKRKSHLILLAIGVLVAVSFNADTLMMVRAFWLDPDLRAATAAAATEYVKTHQSPGTPTTSSSQAAPAPVTNDKTKKDAAGSTKPAAVADNYPSTTQGETASGPNPEGPYTAQQRDQEDQDYRAALEKSKGTINDATQQLLALQVPLGWCRSAKEAAPESEETKSAAEPSVRKEFTELQESAETEGPSTPCDPDHQFPPPCGTPLLLKFCGLFITTLALSQGAPFWFDLLKKVVNLRLAGESPDEKKK